MKKLCVAMVVAFVGCASNAGSPMTPDAASPGSGSVAALCGTPPTVAPMATQVGSAWVMTEQQFEGLLDQLTLVVDWESCVLSI